MGKAIFAFELWFFLPVFVCYGQQNHWIEMSTDIVRLERTACSFESAKKEAHNLSVIKTRRQAYIRLGNIGTKDATAAIQRIEDQIQANRKLSLRKTSSKSGGLGSSWTHPFSGQPPRSALKSPGSRREFDVVRHGPFLQGLYVLPKANLGTIGPRPVLLPCPFRPSLLEEIQIEVGRRDLVISGKPLVAPFSLLPGASASRIRRKSNQIEWTIRRSRVFLDSDKDGWTDTEEAKMQLDPNRSDTDGDGLDDFEDPSPLLPIKSALPADDDDNQILQRSFLTLCGFAESSTPILVTSKPRNVHFWYSTGPVLHPAANSSQASVWGIKLMTAIKNAKNATVYCFVSYGGTLESDYVVRLKKVEDLWVVIDNRLRAKF